MIVRAGSDKSLFLIAQADHAELAARIMAEWKGGEWPQHPQRERILRAQIAFADKGFRRTSEPNHHCRPKTLGSDRIGFCSNWEVACAGILTSGRSAGGSTAGAA